MRLIICILVFSLSGFVSARAESDAGLYSVFAPYAAETRYTIDHQPWTDFLGRAVYAVGRSDRQPARRQSSQFRIAGTRLSTGSTSPYRYEGNRVQFHTFDDDVIVYVGLYRQALQDTVNRIEYGDLSRDEQLAFWLNLHNAVVIHEIAKAHPISKPSRIRIREQDARLFDAKLLEVKGVPLSLNDIKYNIVYRYWRSPDVIYGFWEGTIGGPNILPVAFGGRTVKEQLSGNAREFVNSLRGVDDSRGGMRLSELYFRARPYFFDTWPDDLYAHLARYADYAVATALSDRPAEPRANRYAENVADVNSGETVRPTGNDNAAAVAAGADLGGRWASLTSDGLRGGFSSEALVLQEKVEDRRARRVGTVTVLDIYTDDPDSPAQTLSVEPDDGASDGEPE